MSEEVTAVGWDAIDQALSQVYGEQEPMHYGTLIPYSLGGQDPLDGISVYKSETSIPHWHFVTYGFSELYEKEFENKDYSGYGFELTFRLVCQIDEEEPPAWALNLLQNMGRYVFNSGNVFRAGDYLDANGPICLDADTQLTALAFTHDPELAEIDTPNGKMAFIQMVGITEDELEAMQTWNTLGVLEAGIKEIQSYITDLTRTSLLQNPEVAEAVARGMEEDGSNTGFLFVDQLAWEVEKKGWFNKQSTIVQLGAKQADVISKLLRGRILKDKDLSLVGQQITIIFKAGHQVGFSENGQEITITLNKAAVEELSQKLIPQESQFTISSLADVSFQILKTYIKNQEGAVVKQSDKMNLSLGFSERFFSNNRKRGCTVKQCVEHFLAAVWEQLTAVYQQESKRITDLKEQSRLQAGIFHYLKVTWKKGKSPNGTILIDVYEPFSWSDSSYKVEAGPYIQEFTNVHHIEELFSALCTKTEAMFQSEQYGPRFFDYRFQVVLEFEDDKTVCQYQKELLNNRKLESTKQVLATFIETKVMAELPVRPSDNDEFFFAQYLVNPHFFHQTAEEVEPLIHRLQEKHRANKERLDQWIYYYTMAFKHWAEERFLTHYFEQTGDYMKEWVLITEDPVQQLEQEKLDFFLYVALKIGQKEPATRLEYLELAKQLGSRQAADYLEKGSGRFESIRKRDVFQGQANDILQTIDIRVMVEEEAAYREALCYINQLLEEGFPKGYKLTLKSKAKNYLPIKKLAKSKLHQFFANCLEFPNLFPLLADYAQLAMEEFTWYQDVEPSEKSAMPGTYAVLGLGLSSRDYFTLVQRYMLLVDTEHQSVQDAYAEAFLEAHGLSVEIMPVFVAILLGASESAKPLKGIDIRELDLLVALRQELEKKEDYQRAFALYQIFGSSKKFAQRLKQESAPIKDELEKLLQWMDS